MSPNRQKFCKGITTVFRCSSTANPPAEYSLYLNNQLIQKRSDGVFSVQLNEKGEHTFTCVPNNTVGIGKNRTLQFAVAGKLRA